VSPSRPGFLPPQPPRAESWSGWEEALSQEGEAAGDDQQEDVDQEDHCRAHRVLDSAAADRDPEVGRGGDRGHRDRDADRRGGAGLEGEHAGDARREGDQHRRVVGHGEGAEAAFLDREAVGQQAGPFEQRAQHRGGDDNQAQAEGEGGEGAAGELAVAADEADRGGTDRQQVGADRHRADDQDRAAGDDAEGGDHGGDVDQRQVARQRPRVGPRLTEDFDPGEAVDAALAMFVVVLGRDHVDPGQDVIVDADA
jgi:hypothetical protein